MFIFAIKNNYYSYLCIENQRKIKSNFYDIFDIRYKNHTTVCTFLIDS